MEKNGTSQVTMPTEPLKSLTPTKPFSLAIWQLMIVVLTIFYGSFTVLVHLCEVDGKIPFRSSSLILMIECMKLLISLSMYISEVRLSGEFSLPSLRFAMPFAVPALLYCFNNNTGVHMQMQMDPASYQVLGNLKVLSTAFLYRIIIKRPILRLQWIALFLLAIAGTCNSYGGLQQKMTSSSESDTNMQVFITGRGIAMVISYCLVSGLAGVSTEYIMKKQYQSSIHLQNLILYTFGILFNGVTYLSQDGRTELDNLFTGYSLYTWMIVITQALSGLMFSAIMKHSSNIARLFVISCAMLVTTILSMVLFNLQLNIYFMSSFLLVVIAIALYHNA